MLVQVHRYRPGKSELGAVVTLQFLGLPEIRGTAVVFRQILDFPADASPLQLVLFVDDQIHGRMVLKFQDAPKDGSAGKGQAAGTR